MSTRLHVVHPSFLSIILFISVIFFAAEGRSNPLTDEYDHPFGDHERLKNIQNPYQMNALFMLVSESEYLSLNGLGLTQFYMYLKQLIADLISVKEVTKLPCRRSINPSDVEDLIKSNHKYTGCTLELTGEYIIGKPLFIKNLLVSAPSYEPYTGGLIGVQSLMNNTLFSHPMTQLPSSEPAILTLKEGGLEEGEPTLVVKDSGRIDGVIVNSEDLSRDSQGCLLTTGIDFQYTSAPEREGNWNTIYFYQWLSPYLCLKGLPDESIDQIVKKAPKKISEEQRRKRKQSEKDKKEQAAKNKNKEKAQDRNNLSIASARQRLDNHGLSTSAGDGRYKNDDKDKKVKKHDLVQLLQKMHTAKNDKATIEKLTSEFTSNWGRASTYVQNDFKTRYSESVHQLEIQSISDLMK